VKTIYRRYTSGCDIRSHHHARHLLLERRIGAADITVRFPRDWLGA